MTWELDGQASLFDQDTWSGKTSPERSAATAAKTSRQSLKKQSKSSSRKPPVLKCLTRGGQHGEDTETWTDDGAWLGEYLTRNTGESPNVVVESRLSQILEETPHTKYYLTTRACQGILNRAARRGKELPPPAAASSSGTSKSYSIGGYNSEGMLSDNPHSGVYEANTSRTLDLNGGNPACNQGGIAIVKNATFSEKRYADYSDDSRSATLKADGGSYGGSEVMVVHGGYCSGRFQSIPKR